MRWMSGRHFLASSFIGKTCNLMLALFAVHVNLIILNWNSTVNRIQHVSLFLFKLFILLNYFLSVLILKCDARNRYYFPFKTSTISSYYAFNFVFYSYQNPFSLRNCKLHNFCSVMPIFKLYFMVNHFGGLPSRDWLTWLGYMLVPTQAPPTLIYFFGVLADAQCDILSNFFTDTKLCTNFRFNFLIPKIYYIKPPPPKKFFYQFVPKPSLFFFH